MLKSIATVFVILIVPVFLYAVSCILAGTAAKRKCHGCGLSGIKNCGSCEDKKED